MKLISMADIHSDFETLDKALGYVKASDAEVLAITGDLSGTVFENSEREGFAKCRNILRQAAPQILERTGKPSITLRGTAKFLIDYDKATPEAKKVAEEYVRLEELAHQRMLSTYREFKSRFDELQGLGKKVMLVPGNWDGKCIDDIDTLAHANLHQRHLREIGGVTFTGYGGSPKNPNELPIDLTPDFDSHEAFVHLATLDPDVALIYAIPAGYEFSDDRGKYTFSHGDVILSGNSHAERGQYSLSAYLYRNKPYLILTGDTHKCFSMRDATANTVVANPGNLGRHGKEAYGTFLEIEIDKTGIEKPAIVHSVGTANVEDAIVQ